MKKNLFICCLLTGILSLSAKERVIDNPHFVVSSHDNVIVTQINLTDNATLLRMEIGHSPRSWIRIDSKTYIKVGDKKYFVESADGITLDKETYSDETNKTAFVLKFAAIDPKAKALDFIETDCEDCFKIWGLNLNPDVVPVFQEIPQAVKDLAVVTDDGQPLAIPVWKEGVAVLKGTFLNYPSGMNTTVNVYVDNPLTGIQEELETKVTGDGTFSIDVPLVTTMEVLLRFPSYNKYVLLSPGEESTIYVDLHQRSYKSTMNNVLRTPHSKYIYWGGAYADINNYIEDIDLQMIIRNAFFSNRMLTDIVGMDAAQYKQYVLGCADKAISSLSDKKLNNRARDYAVISIKNQAMHSLFFGSNYLMEAYRRANNLNYDDKLTDYARPTFGMEYYSFMKELDINNPLHLYSAYCGNNANSAKYVRIGDGQMGYSFEAAKSQVSQILGTSEGIVFDLMSTQTVSKGFEEYIPLTAEGFETLKKLSSPFYLDYLTRKNEALIAQIEANKGKMGYTVHDTPQTEGEQFFLDIVKPFEGKVILIDFWATWCGPCRSAMKQFEPVKDGLKEKGVVFIYLTDESSPKGTWENMIPTIPGEHYRMTNAQFSELKKKFGVRGIPSYLILNKKGEQVYFKVGFEGAGRISQILNDELIK